MPLMNGRVTVVIPVKNDAALLRRCLEALAHQTVRPHEIIVVDNCSEDDSARVALDFDVRLIGERTPGIAAASSAGYDLASTELIARLDADSVPGETWVEDIRRSFEAHPTAVAITGGATFIDGPRRLRAPAIAGYLGLYYLLVSLALGHPPLFGSNLAMRTDAWRQVSREVHRTDTLMHDDMDLAMHLGPLRRIYFDRHLTMGISMRPLTTFAGSGLRIRRGFHTLTAHWPRQLPWLRVFRRLREALRMN
jgi:glycosyltransferase involved in cell wall biosynthesis